MSTSLPPVDPSALPADIRTGSQKTKQAYTAALGFERMLVEQLAKALNSTAQPSDDSSDDGTGSGTDAATSTYRDMLPGALADGIMTGGGLGLARQLVPADATATKKASS